jgi:glycosyltransferase involved in cell wall biosynthesis
MKDMNFNLKIEPLITIYITNYNYGRYIKRAIDSVLEQTLQDFELIIIDDGSSDSSCEIINKYLIDPKIRAIFQKNKGLTATNNIALKEAKGKYIMRLDADDWLDPYALEILSNVLKRNSSVALVFPDYYLVNAEGRVMEQVRRHDFTAVTLLDQPAHGACTMIRCDCLKLMGGYDENYTCQDGYFLWIRIIEQFEVRNVNLPLFFYRQHSSSLTKNEERILITRSEIIHQVVESKGPKIKVLAVVAVRGPSYDNSSTSLKLFGDKFLIDWTLQAALDASRLSKVVISTPDNKILSHANSLCNDRLMLIERPADLAISKSSLLETLRHALEQAESWGERYDAVLQLSIESPFRTANHIDSAVEIMELFGTDMVIGVRPETDNFYQHDGHGLSPISDTNQLRLERDEIFREVGSMRLLRREQVINNGYTSSATRIGHLVIDQRAAFRLASNFDWALGELIVKTTCEEHNVLHSIKEN